MLRKAIGTIAVVIGGWAGNLSLDGASLDLDGVPPAANVLSRVMGSDNDGSYGVPVTGGFDCDGDGHRDTAFAQITSSPLGRSGAGQAMLVFGSGTIQGPEVNSAGLQSGILKVAGATAGEVCGAEIWMDDLTGDGVGDFIIGRQNYDSVSGNTDAGALTILVGGAALRAHANTETYFDLGAPPAGVKVVTFEGKAAGNRLGIWMRTGDVTGDGIADLVVGADQANEQGNHSGSVWVIRGGPHLATAPSVVDLADFGSTALEGHLTRILPPPASTGDHFGATCTVGDLDGNGRAEVLGAAALNRRGASIGGDGSGGTTEGTLFIAWDENFPPWLWPAGYTFEVTNPPIGDFTRIDGGQMGPFGPSSLTTDHDSFGEEIVAGKDYSGDGCPDLYIGDLAGDVSGRSFNAGVGHVFWNAALLRGRSFTMNAVPAGIPFNTIIGPSGGSLGNDTVAHGDFDGDGIDDLAIGNPHDDPNSRGNSGSVHVLYGQSGGWPDFVDLKAANLPPASELRFLEIQGAKANDVLCYSAASGDVDQDGKDDFIVNEMTGDNSAIAGSAGQGVGNMLVISGGTMLPPTNPSLMYTPAGVIQFGANDIGGGSPISKEVTITNSSGGTVQILSLGLTGPQGAPFSIASDTGETSLAPGKWRTVGLNFLPATTGWYGAGLVVTTDVDPYRSGVGLKGAGVDGDLVLELKEFSRVGGETRFLIKTQPGYVYDLLRDIVIPPLGVEESMIPGTGSLVPVIDGGPLPSSHAIYQVRGAPLVSP
jgi:hypothetical protein